jgi:hypothetical protein
MLISDNSLRRLFGYIGRALRNEISVLEGNEISEPFYLRLVMIQSEISHPYSY